MSMAYSPATKHVFIVDDDIDVTNEADVLWALATRFKPTKIWWSSTTPIGSRLNPPTYGYRRDDKGTLETKLIFDCTRPLSAGKFPAATARSAGCKGAHEPGRLRATAFRRRLGLHSEEANKWLSQSKAQAAGATVA